MIDHCVWITGREKVYQGVAETVTNSEGRLLHIEVLSSRTKVMVTIDSTTVWSLLIIFSSVSIYIINHVLLTDIMFNNGVPYYID